MATYDLTSGIPAANTLAAGDILNCPYSGSYKAIQLPAGTYKLEVWGAQGGSYTTSYPGGKGGYATGVYSPSFEIELYLYAGGQGTSTSTSTYKPRPGGFNGGGTGGQGSSGSYGLPGAGGGGASDIRINDTALTSRIIVAGGGGGAGGPGCNSSATSLSASTSSAGGAAGVNGANSGQTTYGGKGGGAGTTSGGGAGGAITTKSKSGSDGTYYAGGGGGGGAGYYGGGGGGGGSLSQSTYRGTAGSVGTLGTGGAGGASYSSGKKVYYGSGGGAGGGGSSWTSTELIETQALKGNVSFVGTSGSSETGHAGNGYVRITIIEVIFPEEPDSDKKPKLKVKNDSSRLPSGYTEVEYIESNGTQYIDTGFIPNQDTRVTMDAQINTNPTAHMFLFGSRAAPLSNSFTFIWYHPDHFRADYNNTNEDFSVKAVLPTTRLKIDFNKNTVSLNDWIVQHTYANSGFNCPVNLYLFAGNTNGSLTRPASMKLYSCQIYDNNVLIRNYVPAIENSTGNTGLYDLITQTFFKDASTDNRGFGYGLKPGTKDPNLLLQLTGDSFEYEDLNIQQSNVVLSKVGKDFNSKSFYFNGTDASLTVKLEDIEDRILNGFTVEAWLCQTSNTNSTIPTAYTIGNDGIGIMAAAQMDSTIKFHSENFNTNATGGSTILGKWYHIAQVRLPAGTTRSMIIYNFVDGKLVSTCTSTSEMSINYLNFGAYSRDGVAQSNYWQGYMSNICVSKGAKWLSDFTPPEAPQGLGWVDAEKLYVKTETTNPNLEYTRLAYIESNSLQYIDTKLPITKDSGFEVDFQLLEIPTSTVAITGGFTQDAQNFQFVADADGIWKVYIGTGGNTSYSLGPVDTERHKVKVNGGLTGQLIFDNEEYNLYGASINHAVLDNTDRTFHICCANGGEGRLNYNIGSMKIYGCKYYDGNGTLVRDYIPAMYNANYKIGLLNRLTGEFFADANNINFVGGFIETIDPATMLILNGQSFENQAVNTNIQVTKNNGVVLSSINNGSMYFNGSSYLELSPYEFEDADFTIDWWDCIEDVSTNRGIFSSVYGTALADTYGISLYVNTAQEMHLAIKVYADALQKENTTTTTDVVAMSSHPLKIWNHKAIIKQGNKIYATLNGKIVNQISAGNFAIYDNIYSPMILGAYNNNGALVYFKGWIKDFRISRMARWQREFTPETTALGNPWKEINTIYIREPNPPAGYTRLEYLESTGTQYIDTGYIPNSDSRVVIDCIFQTNTDSYYLFSASARKAGFVDNYGIQTSGNRYYSKHGDANIYVDVENIEDRMLIGKNGNNFFVNGNLGYNTPVDFSCPCSAYIFASNAVGVAYGICPAGTRVYGCKIYDGEGNLVRDFVPMQHNDSKASGLYDLVNNTFHPNAVEGDFIYKKASLWRKI